MITVPTVLPLGRRVVAGDGSAGYLEAFIELRGHAAGVP
jgi:hypothetical protein